MLLLHTGDGLLDVALVGAVCWHDHAQCTSVHRHRNITLPALLTCSFVLMAQARPALAIDLSSGLTLLSMCLPMSVAIKPAETQQTATHHLVLWRDCGFVNKPPVPLHHYQAGTTNCTDRWLRGASECSAASQAAM